MICYEYSFPVKWGEGSGVVFAKSKKAALKAILEEDEYVSVNSIKEKDIDLIKIDTGKAQLLPHSWCD